MKIEMAILRRLPPQLRRPFHRLLWLPADLIDQLTGNRDDLIPPRGLTFVGAGDFKEVGERHLKHLKSFCSLAPTCRVLELGCGIGRLAVPLTGFLEGTGEYHGIDVTRRDIDWCRKYISSRFGNFTFHYVDIKNEEYNRRGGVGGGSYQFDFPDECFDIVVAISLFTHLLTETATQYFREISRVLVPGGRFLISFFLLNDESRDQIEKGLACHQFPNRIDSAHVERRDEPAAAVAYDEGDVRAYIESLNLQIVEPVYYGSWCSGFNSVDYQDIVIGKKAANLAQT